MAGFSGLLHHGARASVANGHRTQPVGTIEVSASPLSPAASRTEHSLLSCVHARDKFDAWRSKVQRTQVAVPRGPTGGCGQC